jgi:hypothetical protein
MAKAITLKKALLVIGITAVLGMAYALYQWYKPARDVKDEDGIPVTAQVLFDAYSQNETSANATYLNKAVQVAGEVSTVKANQEGKVVVTLKTADPMFGVQCTMKEKVGIKVGEKVTIKGICTGFLMDVVLIDCVVVNE